ncbi:MAG: DUF1343 domain-containing protein [Clostridium sp.]|nr:DUF1343 domain-containing protein [Clostridium sp.]
MKNIIFTYKQYLIAVVTFVAAAICSYGAAPEPLPGAARPDLYLPLLEGKKIALLSNHTGVVPPKMTHTLDEMRSLGLEVTTLFSPEHGFRGTADAGASVSDSRDAKTGLPVISLYGKGHAQRAERAVAAADVVVVDLQDVGTRFYTYYITMLELMDAAARQGKEFVILDRPNPNGMYVDGPTLRQELYSGVGRLPIPVVHGMTLGELGRMIVGEGWLDSGRQLDLKVVPCQNYTHQSRYSLPVPPSPNLRSDLAVALYPSLCYFEGTPVSVGRGTDNPFTLYGAPQFAAKDFDYSFTPQPRPGATNPPYSGKLCRGESLASVPADSAIARGVDLEYVIRAYRAHRNSRSTEPFFRRFFDNLIGDPSVKQQIIEGRNAEEIRRGWQPDVEQFRLRRRPYLLYPE